jgi:hypothetical protein
MAISHIASPFPNLSLPHPSLCSTTSKMPSSESLTSSFPIPALTPLATGSNRPTYQSIRVTCTQLNSNATSIFTSSTGGGLHGRLTLTMAATKYLTITGVANTCIAPLPPGTLTGPQISESVCLHREQLNHFQLYYNVDKALHNQLIAATPKVFLQAIKDLTFGLGQQFCLDITTHLGATYGEISPDKLD